MSSDTSLIFNIIARDKATAVMQRIQERVDTMAPAIGAGLGAGLTAGLLSELDTEAANDKLAAQLALGPAEAAELASVSASVYTQAWGDSTATVNEAIRGVYQSIGDTSEAEGGLEAITIKTLALSEAFEYDLAEATGAAGTLIKSGLAADGTEAIDLLTAAATRLPPALAGEVPALVTEYGGFFSQLGATGPQTMGLLAEAAKNPVFEIDKIGDSVKEFTLLISDTAAVSEPLQQLGLDVAEIQGLINSGQGTAAFDQVITALAEVETQTERTALTAALMGGPGEDAQEALMGLAAAGGFAGVALEDTAGAGDRLAATLGDNAGSALEGLKRKALMEFGAISGSVAQWAMNNQGAARGVAIALGTVAAAILLVKLGTMAWTAYQAIATAATATWTGVQWLLNAAFWASPITWIVAGIMVLVGVIIYIATQTTWFQDAWRVAWDWIKNVAANVWNWITDHWPLLFGVLTGPIGLAVGFITDNLDSIVQWVRDMPGRIGRAASGMWDGIKSGFKGAVNGIIRGWNNLSFTVGGGSFMGVGIPSFTLGTPNVPYLAQGGWINRAGAAIVGENGAELLNLPAGAQVTPLSRGRGPSGGGGVVRVEIDITGADEDLKRRIRRMVRVDGRGDVQVAFGTGR